jgi:hypothetical protein
MPIKMFQEFSNESVNNIISFKLLDIEPIEKRLSDLKTSNIDYTITPAIYNYYQGKLISVKRINPKFSMVDNLRAIRKNAVGEISPGFRIDIKIPDSTKDNTWLFDKLASIEQDLSPVFRFDSKQDHEGYHVDFIYKTKEKL